MLSTSSAKSSSWPGPAFSARLAWPAQTDPEIANLPAFSQVAVVPCDGIVLPLRISPPEVVVRVAPVPPGRWPNGGTSEGAVVPSDDFRGRAEPVRGANRARRSKCARLTRCPMTRVLLVGIACALFACTGCHSASSYRCTYAPRPAVVAAPACPTPCPNGGVAVPPPPTYPGF